MTSGDTISRYRIIGPLGRGGMGVVYHAEDTKLHRPVALKFLPPDSLSDTDKQRFLNEAQAAAQVRHPNICPIYDIDEVDGQLFIAMAYLEGETLARKLAGGPLEIGAAVEIAIQVARGLEKAHELGIVHRDVKTGNIIVSPDGHVYLLDFGLALSSGAVRVTGIGSTVGTAAYMSPEQARGLNVDGRSDLWSLGVVLFEMLTGVLPFRRDHGTALAHAILTEEPPSVSSLRLGVSPELDRIVAKALSKPVEERWLTAGDFAAALRRTQTSSMAAAGVSAPRVSSGASTRTMPATESAGRETTARSQGAAKSTRSRWLVPAIALLAAVAIFGIYKLVDRPHTTQQVAVLPFDVIGETESSRAVSDGLVEILTTALSELEQFQGKIVAVPSSEIRRRNIGSAEEARRVYGVDLAITGSAQPLGDKLQVTVNLVDAAKLRQVRAKSFVYDPGHPVDSRNQAVEQMAGLLNFELTPAARRVVTAGDTTAPGAYAAYLQGRGLLARYDQAGNLDKSIVHFSDAVRQDPNYALAYSGLGEAYWRKSRAGGGKEAAALAIQNAERAVQLDKSLPIVHTVLGEVYGTSRREEDAIREFRKALELAPGNAEALRELARVYSNLGRFAEAEQSYIEATKARPTDWYGFLLLGLLYYQQERYAEAETAYKRAEALTPDNEIVHRNLGVVYLQQGRYEETIAELQKSLHIKSTAFTYGALGTAYFLQHRFAEATTAAETAIDLDSSRFGLWGNLGIYYKWTPGSEMKAATALHKAVELAEKQLQATPTDYDARADLAEYRARLGDKAGALSEIGSIPEAARRVRASRLAIAYELIGERKEAIELIRSNLKNAASLNQIKDDPDLASLWKDAAFQRAIQAARSGTTR